MGNIAKWGCESRDAERNSYAGGAYTGIGISNSILKQNIDNPKYELLMKILGACLPYLKLAMNHFLVQNNQEFYLNYPKTNNH